MTVNGRPLVSGTAITESQILTSVKLMSEALAHQLSDICVKTHSEFYILGVSKTRENEPLFRSIVVVRH